MPVLLCLPFNMPGPSFEGEHHYVILHLIIVSCSVCSHLQETGLNLRFGAPPPPFYLRLSKSSPSFLSQSSAVTA